MQVTAHRPRRYVKFRRPSGVNINYLQFHRLGKSLTQLELSQLSGVSRMLIMLAEQGRYILTAPEAEALGRVLGVDPSTLLHEVIPAPTGEAVPR